MALEVQTLTYAADVSSRHLYWQETVDNGLRAIELATGDEPSFSQYTVRYRTALTLLRMGDLDAACPHALVLRELAERRSTPRLLASNSMSVITTLSCLAGNWKAGQETSDWGLEVLPLNPQVLGPRVLLENQTGEFAQGEVFLEQLLDVMRRAGPDQLIASERVSMVIPTVARITGIPNRLEIVEAAAEAILTAQSVIPNRAIYAMVGLALLAVQEGDRSAVEERYADLLGQRGTMILTVSSVDRLLGLLSQSMGELDRSSEHFEDALAFCRKAGYRPELAWTCCDYADALRKRCGPGDEEKAVPLLEESLAISSELGMKHLMERVLSQRENFGPNPPMIPKH